MCHPTNHLGSAGKSTNYIARPTDNVAVQAGAPKRRVSRSSAKQYEATHVVRCTDTTASIADWLSAVDPTDRPPACKRLCHRLFCIM